MALVKCGECGKTISNTAPSCPGCGAGGKRSTEQITNGSALLCLCGIAASLFVAYGTYTSTGSMPLTVISMVATVVGTLWLTSRPK